MSGHVCTGNGCDCEPEPVQMTREQLLAEAESCERTAAAYPEFGYYLKRALWFREAAAEMEEIVTEPVFCYFCEEQITDKAIEVRGLFDHLDGYAHDGCYTDAAEKADERSRSDFYGSSSPQTDRERYDAAFEEKRRLG
jgi:hypothetical protein